MKRRMGVALALACWVATGWGAEAPKVEQPWTLDASSWERGKDLLPEPVLRRVKSGEYWFRVVPADAARFHDNYSRPFWEAAAANEDKYDLDSATCGLRDKSTGKVPDFYFCFPFPKIDPKDPEAGCKIAWNFTAASLMAGGTGASFYLNGVDKDGAYRTIRTKIQATSFVGRHGGPIPNPEHLVAKATSVALEPVDVEGVSTLTVRHLDWKTPDDMWAYVPQMRRARHISAASRSDPVAGMDTFAETADRTFSGVLPSLVVGVNDKTNRAAIGGRPQDQFIEQRFNPDDFTLKAISHTSD